MVPALSQQTPKLLCFLMPWRSYEIEINLNIYQQSINNNGYIVVTVISEYVNIYFAFNVLDSVSNGFKTSLSYDICFVDKIRKVEFWFLTFNFSFLYVGM